MPYRDILGQDHAITLLRNVVDTNRMHHALLFTGQRNIGKFKTALALTQKLNCIKIADDACGICNFCIQIAEQNFLDFQVLIPDGKIIKIDQIRKSLNWLKLYPDKAKKRVMIIDGAERLGREAANAFLKTLEEPSPNTLLIIIAESKKNIPETIVSRCQQIRFNPLSKNVCKNILLQNTELTSERINLLSSFSMGSINYDSDMMVDIMEQVQENTIEWLVEFNEIKFEKILRSCEKWGKSKNEEWRFMLDFLETWFRDLAWIHYSLPEEKVINGRINSECNRIASLRKSANFFNLHQINELFDHILESRRVIEKNANKSLTLESLCLQINIRAK